MNFKDEYKRDFDNIKPDDAFKKSLVNQLNKKPVVRSYKRVYANMLAAAAALLLVVGVGYYAKTGISSNSEFDYNADYEEITKADNEADFITNSETITKGDDMAAGTENVTIETEEGTLSQFGGLAETPGGIILYENWYGDAVTDEEIYEVFVSLISGKNLDELYVSDSELFANNNLLSKTEMKEVIEIVSMGMPTDEEFEGDKTFYKAVLEDGTVIRFVISDAGYIRINGRSAVFKVEK